jgi:diguanylate cyclase (GGDEF)-like protein
MLPTYPHPTDFGLAEASVRGRYGSFAPALEKEYARSNLARFRTLIQVACTCAALIAVLRFVEQVLTDSLNRFNAAGLAFIVVGSLALMAVAWSRHFERLYLPWAELIVPARNAATAALIADAAANGHLDMLMLLPLTLIGPFFFLAVRYRTALISGLLCFVAFATSAAAFDLQPSVAWRACAFVVITLGACAISALKIDRWSRTSFLQARVIVQHAQHDALTGLKNRRVFDDTLAQLWPQAVEAGRPLAILLIDVDHFKAYNDRYGHQAGDRALRSVAERLRAFVDRPFDLLARYGGEEFAVILYDVDQTLARATAERMRTAITQLNIRHQGSGIADRVTISIGAAFVRPSNARAAQGALQLADQALYEAKRKGRNQVELTNESDHSMLVTGMFTSKTVGA